MKKVTSVLHDLQGQELDLTILVSPFQLGLFCDSVKLFSFVLSLCWFKYLGSDAVYCDNMCLSAESHV